jgi:hypothetical protein
LVDETAPVVLIYVLGKLAVTFTVTVQELFTATVPPVRLTVLPPAVAVAVPPHVLVRLLGVATTRFTGKLSVKATPFSCTVFAAGLVIVIVSVETPPGTIEVGLKALAIDGGATTVIEAVAVLPVPWSLEIVTELFFTPALVPATPGKVNVQVWFGPKLSPERVMVLPETARVPPLQPAVGF